MTDATAAPSPAPLVFLDVDGCLNALGDSEGRLPHDRADRFVTTLIESETGNYVVRYRPDVIARLNALHEAQAAEFLWLTTWGRDASERFAPAVGLADFPVVDIPPNLDAPDGLAAYPWRPGVWWKLQTVLDLTATGRRYAWLDDDLHAQTKTTLRRQRPQANLLVTPPPSLGLTGQLLNQLDYFCARPTV